MAGELQGIAGWRLLGVLGEGEHGTVYRAVEGDGDGATERALKVLHPAVLHDEAEAEAFRARVEVARGLGHPAIVAVYGVGEADGRPYAVFEKVEGIALADLGVRRGKGRLKPEPAAHVLRGVLDALAAAAGEEAPVAHGRLDAGDVLLTADGEVRLTGFGVPGQPQADLLPLARLAQELCATWPPEVDAWIDRLQHGDDPFPDAAAALEAFPEEAFDPEAASAGLTGLRRAVRRVLRKREREREDAEAEAPDGSRPAPTRRAKPKATPKRSRPDPAPPEEANAAARQARGVAVVCLAVVIVALTLEIIRFGG